MPNTRAKLIELFRGISHENCFGSIERIVDHLIANGVTVQEWISVKDRLPEKTGLVLGYDIGFGVLLLYYEAGCVRSGWQSVTHWMPLPQPPKEENEPIYCKDCEHLMFSDCYGECSKGHKGIVKPNDTCKYATRKLPKGE